MEFRPHISLEVTDLEAAITFYRKVFNTDPTKRYDDYANFRLTEPALHLALVIGKRVPSTATSQHFGVELFADSQLQQWRARVIAAGLTPRIEVAVTCCYAVADKFWLTDPDGHDWEFWVRHDEADTMHGRQKSACCAAG